MGRGEEKNHSFGLPGLSIPDNLLDNASFF